MQASAAEQHAQEAGDITWTRLAIPAPANDNWPMPKVVALTGLAGSGKSTVADYLVRRHGYVRVKFAGPLKDMCRSIGLTEDHIEGSLKELPSPLLAGRTPRFVMQTLGTEWGRDIIGPNFWTGLWCDRASDVLDHGGRVVVDDCRFENEADAVRGYGGLLIRIEGRGGVAGSHASEAGAFDVDAVLHNTGSVGELFRRTLEILCGGK